MYRPKEPEDGRPDMPRAQAGRTPASLLDLISHPQTEQGAETYRRLAVSEPEIQAPPPPEARPEEQPSDHRAWIQGRLNAGLHSLRELGPADILLWLQQRLRLVVCATMLGICAAAIYGLTATPRYTVYTDLIIDPQNLNVVSDDVFASSPQREAQLLEVESRLRVLTSRNALRQVISDLKLTEDPEFVKPGPFEPLLRMFSSGTSQQDLELGVLRQLSERVEARREERSFVVVLSVWSEDPDKAVLLSESVVRAFETELFESAATSAGRIASGLGERLDELRSAVTAAEEKVEAFRRENDLQATAGELANSRMSSLVDTQVVEAQQRLIQADARYAQMQAAVASGQAATAAVFDSPAMTTLRGTYNTLRQQVGSMERTYGQLHPRLIALRSEEAALRNAIADEAERILQSARTDMEQARTALQELRATAEDGRTTVYVANDAQVRLRELERDARAKATVYETFLARTTQIAERQQIDATNVRVISPAVPPQSKSWPPRTVILAAAGAVAGAGLGVGLAIAMGLLGHLRNLQPIPSSRRQVTRPR